MTECSYYNAGFCRSCELIKLPYSEQLLRKTSWVQGCLEQASLAVFPPVAACIASENLFSSRNKSKMAVGGSKVKPLLGFFNADFTVSDITDCPLHVDPIAPILGRIKELILEFEIVPYDVAQKNGELKYVIVRTANQSRQTIVRFVVRSKNQLRKLTEIAQKLEDQFDDICVVSVNLQPIHQAVMEGDEEIILTSREFAVEQIGRYFFAFSPKTFGQINSGIAEKLYGYVSNRIHTSGAKSILDLYCGVGAFSVFSHGFITRSTGVELAESSIKNARQSAELNGITNLHFVNEDVEKFISEFRDSVDAVILNPPRRGLTEKVCQGLVRAAPKQILYSSCNPETLGRDLKLLCETYQIESVQPFDMFPLTQHVEAVATLVHRSVA